MFDLLVKDNFFSDADALRADVLARGFSKVRNPADGLDYTGIQVRDPKEFQNDISELMGFEVHVGVNVARINFAGEIPENSIHADNAHAEFASVGYLCPSGMNTGTAFWSDKLTGWEEMPTKSYLAENDLDEATVVARLRSQTNDASKWVNSGFIAARPGRFIVYPTKRFHSRYPFSAFGTTPETARIVLVSFFSRA